MRLRSKSLATFYKLPIPSTLQLCFYLNRTEPQTEEAEEVQTKDIKKKLILTKKHKRSTQHIYCLISCLFPLCVETLKNQLWECVTIWGSSAPEASEWTKNDVVKLKWLPAQGRISMALVKLAHNAWRIMTSVS